MRLSPGQNQPPADVVMTPRPLALEIIQHFNPGGVVLDPCRGEGAFFDQFETEKDWCEITEGRDFFSYSDKVDWIITNPPWSLMRPWIGKSMDTANDIVLLSTLTHFLTKARLRMIKASGFGLKEFYCVPTPKTDWPASGFQLGAMHIQKGYTGPLDITGAVGE